MLGNLMSNDQLKKECRAETRLPMQERKCSQQCGEINCPGKWKRDRCGGGNPDFQSV